VAELEAILGEPCLAPLRWGGRLPSFDGAPALRAWWQDGGEDWMMSPLGPERDSLALPPDPRRMLTKEQHLAHPLASLFCAIADSGCGRETAGWAMRAEQVFSRAAADPPKAEAAAAACAGHTERRFAEWLGCIEAARPVRPALPIGRFRAPKTGWLVLRGRRGHYQFCDEVSAYDLATGSAYIARSCAALFADSPVEDRQRAALGPPPRDLSRTAQRKIDAQTGQLPIENLREAAWMVLLAPELSSVRRGAAFPIPAGITPRPLEGDPKVLRREVHTDAETRVAWDWEQAGKAFASGHLLWDGSRQPDRHAQHLVEVALAALEPGCPPTPLPQTLYRWGPSSGVSRVDASAEELQVMEERLYQALAEASRRCTRR
jgi:hypothetical protein